MGKKQYLALLGIGVIGFLLYFFLAAIGIDFTSYLIKPVFPSRIDSFLANCETEAPIGFDFTFFGSLPMQCHYETKEGADFNTCYREYFESANHGLVLVEDTCSLGK